MKGKDGKFLNKKTDKRVWYKWMELRVRGDVEAIRTPTGLIPRYDDLKELFMQALKEEYAEKDYTAQFTVRVSENLAKIDRIEKIYRTVVMDTPEILFRVLEKQQERLLQARQKFGEYITPDKF